MAPPPRRTSRANVTKSYKNTCGASAPRGNIKQPANAMESRISAPPAKKLKMTGGSLTCVKSGEALSPGAVNHFFHYPSIV
jgi:hypothetical protein